MPEVPGHQHLELVQEGEGQPPEQVNLVVKEQTGNWQLEGGRWLEEERQLHSPGAELHSAEGHCILQMWYGILQGCLGI